MIGGTVKVRFVSVAALAVLAASAAGQTVSAPATAPKDASADFVLPGLAEPLPEPLRAAVEAVRAEALAAHVRFLASPALEGRGLGSPGLEAALEYAASQLALAGVAPLAPSFFQAVPMREIREPGGSVELERRSGETAHRRTFLSGADVVVPPQPARSVTAPVVFAGYGIREAALGRDDFKGLDVRGKVVAVREGVPPGEAWKATELVAKYAEGDAEERWSEKVKTAKALGAIGILAVEGEEWTGRITGKEKPWPFAFRSVVESAEPLVVRSSPVVLEALLGAPPKPDEATRALPGVVATLRATGVERLGLSRNVVGVLPGSEPSLNEEAVVLGAHVDHLGRAGGVIHPGADDNASGVAALLEIARSLAAAPVRPKRTVVFAFWTGEEEDKIGSGHWVRHPLWPLGRTAAYLNFDMIGHPWLAEEIRTLVTGAGLPGAESFLSRVKPEEFVEPGLARWAPDLGPILARAGRATGLALHLDWTDGVNGGSDYRDFARARVPFVRFFGNFHPAYHEPGDSPETLDPLQVRRVARLGLATAWLLADR
ncbi:MAG: M20/M25/M40 family metallo-hydrolase [Thermoanaerobaculia bacterium]